MSYKFNIEDMFYSPEFGSVGTIVDRWHRAGVTVYVIHWEGFGSAYTYSEALVQNMLSGGDIVVMKTGR